MNMGHAYTQLEPGQRFHHQGKNGVVYFKLDVVEQADGSIFPMTETAPACNILPLVLDEAGMVTHLYMLSQKGRPEMGEGSVALKSVGSFCKAEESTRACAVRSLREKLAMDVEDGDLIYTGQSYGFGPQFKFPIDLYVTKVFHDLNTPLMEGCERLRMSLEEVALTHRDRKFFNSETVDLIATVLMRNAYREKFPW